MEKIQDMNDVAKEVLMVLDCLDNNLIEKIPTKFLDYLNDLAKTSNYNVYIDTERSLIEQNISEESKDLIALIYYSYIADEKEKREIEKAWNKNEEVYQKELSKKYNPDNIFKNEIQNENTKKANLPVQIKKEHLLDKIMKFIKNIFNKN